MSLSKKVHAHLGVITGFSLGAIVGIAVGIIGLIALGIIAKPISTIALFQSPTPTFTATPLPTLTPTPTHTPIPPTLTVTPTATITSTPLPPEGEAFSIGQSVEGRELLIYRFGNGPTVRLIVAAIHGGYEANTIYLAKQLVDDLNAGLFVVPPELTLYILPDLNPDGAFNYPDSKYGRANANQVDLNRNWDSHWAVDWPRTGCFNYAYLTAGDYPFSEPETRALRDFLLNNQVDALISYHSQMGAIFSHGSSPLDPAADDLAATLAAASGYLYPPPETGCLYTGQLVDWALDNGIAALTIELTTHQSLDLEINRKILEAFLAWKRP